MRLNEISPGKGAKKVGEKEKKRMENIERAKQFREHLRSGGD